MPRFGTPQDQSALYGVLAEIEALGLDLLEIRKLAPQRRSPGSGDRRSPWWPLTSGAPSPATRRCRSHDQCPRARPARRASNHARQRSAPAHRLPRNL